MKHSKYIYLLAGAVVVLAAVGIMYFKTTKRQSRISGSTTNAAAASLPARSSVNPQDNVGATSPQNAAGNTTNFLGTMTPGGSAESAGRERTYLVTYQVAFLRKAPAEKLKEENMTYQQLQERDSQTLPPYVFYGESVLGKFDPAHPESIAVRATIYGKEVKGYIDAAKLWLEPPLDRADSPRYMSLKDGTVVSVVPDSASPAVLSLLQGEVVEVVGQLNFQGRQWIKARFNGTAQPRYGFLQRSDVTPLTPSMVNQSVVVMDEIPRQIRGARLALSETDRKRLSQIGFYIEAMPPLDQLSVDDLVDSYRDIADGEQFFITSDLFFHSYHLIFDRMLQDVEEKKLFSSVKQMSSKLTKITEDELNALPASVPALHDALLFDLFYVSVGAKLFDPDFVVPSAVRAQAEAVVSRVQAADGALPSLGNFIGPDQEDFTQYKIRGHYEKNQISQRYFRGMMWFGRQNFLLSDDTKTLAAILLPNLVDEAQQTRPFETLDALITYLVGRQDKYTFAGYRAVNRKIFGTETPTPAQLTGNLTEGLAAFRRAVASDLPAPQIVSVQTGAGLTQDERLAKTGGFKFLGQRYSLDAFLLNQLTSPSVGTDSNPRNLPSALDVMMMLGSNAASEVQQQSQAEHHWANYENQVKKLGPNVKEQLTKPAAFYDQWLVAVNALFLPGASKQMFALGKPWQYKNLNAGAASWTELKHDTILYAEQSEAEMGEGSYFEIPPYVPPEPKGYVEPNPLFFHQLGISIDQMLDQMRPTGFITEEYLDKFSLFRDLAHKAEAIAQKEVSGDTITREDYQWIQNLRESFDRPLLLPRGADEIKDPAELQMALIVDVATDAVGGRVLEVGTGVPQRIVVVVKDAFGGTRLTIGYVYSWFEFPSPKRWSDSEWKKVIYAKDESSKKQNGIEAPSWYSQFLKNSSGAR